MSNNLMGPVTLRDLADLTDQGQARRWQANHENSRVPIFTTADLTELMRADRSSIGHYRFLKTGRTIDPAMMRLVDERNQFVPERIEALKQQGITIMASRLETKVPSIRKIARAIQRATSSYVRVVAIASFGLAHGMPCHYDHVDVLVVQTQGQKTWRLFGGPIAGAGIARSLEAEAPEVSDVIRLAYSDLLFVPAGIYHQCDPAELSVHLAFNLKWPCGLDFLDITYDHDRYVDTALMEPMRSFSDMARTEDILKLLRGRLPVQMSEDRIIAYLQGWPEQCEERYSTG